MIITRLSASQVESFDPNRSPWGCHTSWWFKHVAKVPVEQDASQQWGDERHKEFEHYLKTGENVLDRQALPAIPHLEAMRPLVRKIEQPLDGVAIGGIPFSGRLDVVLEGPWVHDHKTTSNLKYAKTVEQAANSTQLNIYGLGEIGEAERIRLSLGYIIRKGAPKYHFVDVYRTREQLETFREGCARTVETIKQVALEKNSGNVEKNRAACDLGRGCPFRARCPTQERRDFMINLKRGLFGLKVPEAKAIDMGHPVPEPEPVEVKAPVATQPEPPPAPVKPTRRLVIRDELAAVRPPDAPAPDAAPSPPPEPESKKDAILKRGRPPGARNRPKEVEVPGLGTIVVAGNKAIESTSKGVTIVRATVRKGLKIGLPNYSSATVEIELTADGPDVEALIKKVDELLERETRSLTEDTEVK